MCNRYKAPSKPEEELSIEAIKKLPAMYFTNITGGEPFIRTDLKDIVRELYKRVIGSSFQQMVFLQIGFLIYVRNFQTLVFVSRLKVWKKPTMKFGA